MFWSNSSFSAERECERLKKLQKFLDAVASLPNDAFQGFRREFLIVHRDGHAQFSLSVVEQASMAASLVVNIKTGAQKSTKDIFGSEYRQ